MKRWKKILSFIKSKVMPIALPSDAPAHLRKLVEQKGPEQKTKAWLRARRDILTCSDIAAVLGINPYSTRDDVMRKKLGIGKPFTGNEATRYGSKLEDEAITRFEHHNNKKVIDVDFGLQIHPRYRFLGGSPDGITLDLSLLEIKCPYRRRIKPGEMPAYYKPQVLVLMEIFNLQQAYYMEYRPGNLIRDETCNTIVIKRSPVWFAAQLPKMRAFVEELRVRRETMKSGGTLPPGLTPVKTDSSSDSELPELTIEQKYTCKEPEYRGNIIVADVQTI